MTNGQAIKAIYAVVTLCVMGLIAAVVLYLDHDEHNGIAVAALFGFLTPTIGVLLLIAQGKTNAEKIDETKRRVEDVVQEQNRVETERYR